MTNIIEDEELETQFWQKTDGVLQGIIAQEEFIAEYSHVKSLSFMLNGIDSQEVSDGDIAVSIIDSDGNIISSTSMPAEDVAYRHYQEFELNADVIKGETYTYRIEALQCDIPICAAIMVSNDYIWHPVTRYTYTGHMNADKAKPYVVCILLMGIILSYAVLDKNTIEKKLLMYIFSVLAVIVLIIMSDEGTKTLSIDGNKLNLTCASNDSTTMYINDSYGYSGEVARTNDLVLNKGTYTISTVQIVTNEGSTIEIWDNGDKIDEYYISPGCNYAEHTFTIDGDSEQLSIRILYNDQGSLTVRKLMLTPETRFYSDAYFMAVLFVLLNIVGGILYWKKTSIVTVCVIVGLGTVSCLPYFATSLSGADDLAYHLLRIEGIKNALLDGQFPAVIQPGGLLARHLP